MGCNSNTASLEINKKFKKSSFYQRQWACYFEFSAEPKSERRGTHGGLAAGRCRATFLVVTVCAVPVLEGVFTLALEKRKPCFPRTLLSLSLISI